MKKTSAASAAAMNLRNVVSMEMSFGQDFEPLHPIDGWKVTATEDGELVLRLAGGATQSTPFAVGDHLMVMGDYMYVALAQKAKSHPKDSLPDHAQTHAANRRDGLA